MHSGQSSWCSLEPGSKPVLYDGMTFNKFLMVGLNNFHFIEGSGESCTQLTILINK